MTAAALLPLSPLTLTELNARRAEAWRLAGIRAQIVATGPRDTAEDLAWICEAGRAAAAVSAAVDARMAGGAS